ncbi:MAG TPA: NAD(P)-dependent oxidoreductase [Bacillota bacterium]|nr:NAD(P)-dependent oxidoreductase [Bacillota bacterium]
MKKILITGSKGRIGKILISGLKTHYSLSLADLPEIDVRNYEQVLKAVEGKDAIIHLAWDTKTENYLSKRSNPSNILMAENIYRAALEKGIPRVIFASSVHADDFQNYKENKLLSPNRVHKPITPYGRSKVLIEKLGKNYAKKGLDVICIRFGAVGYEKPTSLEGKMLWLKNNDLISLINTILEAKKIPKNFFVIYGISNNKSRIHDYKNPLGWKPRDDSSK